ncbi:uncharacterized protein LOC143449212 isoform X2 [Clavelina lepadiformis]|uniref:uncharacterized protein LOC143449212 isoform X2 n=1 Tax=Clavelina lepadiformis TaxID=159417 RepID=UPI0040417455
MDNLMEVLVLKELRLISLMDSLSQIKAAIQRLEYKIETLITLNNTGSFVEVKKQAARCKARLPDSRENDVVERSESEVDGSRYFINVELSEDENNLLSETEDGLSDLVFQRNMGSAVNEYNEGDTYPVHLSPDGSDVQNANPLKCPQCERTYSRRAALLQHLQTHSSRLPFHCIYCHKSFKLKGYLTQHLLVHKTEKPFKCTIAGCDKAFKKRRKLQDHLLSHGTERNYSCHVCGKAFKIASTLAVHMKAHQDLRPYQCQQCGMAFKFKGNLKSHIRIHTGERPFECTVCKKSFAQQTTLQIHMRIHTGEKPYKCMECMQFCS